MALVADSSIPLSRVAVGALTAAAFLVSLGYGALMPVLPGWLSSLEPSLPAATVARYVGELGGIYMLGVFLGALVAGYASDAIGTRPVLLCGLVVFVLSQLALVHMDRAITIYALRFLAGVAGAAVVPVGSVLIAERSPKERVPHRLSALGAASLVGFLAGPGLVSLARWLCLGDPADTAALLTFVVHTMAALGAVVLVAIWFVDLRHASMEKACERGRSPTMKCAPSILLALAFATLLGLGGFEVAVALQGSQRLRLDALQIGAIFAECSLVMLLVNGLLLLEPLRRRLPIRQTLLAGLAAMVAGFLLLLRGADYVSTLAGVGVVAAGSGVAIPMITWTVAGASGPLGTSMGQLTAAGSLGQALGSVVGGWAFGAFASNGFLIGGSYMALVLFFAWVSGATALAVPPRAVERPKRPPIN